MQLLSRLSHTAVTFGHVSLAIAAKTGEGDDNMIRYIMEHVNLGSGQGQVTDIEKVDISVFRMKNDEENTPLHEALINGNHLEARYLIKADPSVSFSAKKEKKRPTPPPPPPPRYLAAEAGLIEIVTLIVDSVAIQNNTGDQDSSGTLPIHSASSKGHVHIVKLLLEHYPKKKGISCERMNNQLVKGKTLDSITSSSVMEEKGLDVEADEE
ncbi:hypothetical protein ACLB2K_036708 [Fragaria x ananassa]